MIQRDDILKKGENAQNQIINAILYIADLIKSSLGPFGMRKMIIEKYGTIIISNDGLTIIKDIGVAHPAADSLIQMGKSYVNNVGDGLKTTILIIGELLRNGNELIKKGFHPIQIIRGYNIALNEAMKILKKIASPIQKSDQEQLFNIAKNALSGKFSDKVSNHLSRIAVEAVQTIMAEKFNSIEVDIKNIQFQKVDGRGILDSKIIKGILISKEILDPKMTKLIKDAKIALIDE